MGRFEPGDLVTWRDVRPTHVSVSDDRTLSTAFQIRFPRGQVTADDGDVLVVVRDRAGEKHELLRVLLTKVPAGS